MVLVIRRYPWDNQMRNVLNLTVSGQHGLKDAKFPYWLIYIEVLDRFRPEVAEL